jgi:6-pyruvoyl-tetrahydropterin synthase
MMLYTTFAIECAHRIAAPLGEPDLHGHSYWVQVYVDSNAAAPYPLHELENHAGSIKDMMDHRLLNDVLPQGTEPTMEAIADFVRAQWRGPTLQKIIIRRDTLNAGVEWLA